MAAAKSGNPSSAFKCAPLALTSELYVDVGIFPRKISRFVRGAMFVAVKDDAVMPR